MALKKRVFLDLGSGRHQMFVVKPRLMQMAEREKAKKESRWRLVGVDKFAEPVRGKSFAILKSDALNYLKKKKDASIDVINSDLFVGSIHFEKSEGKEFKNADEFLKAAAKQKKAYEYIKSKKGDTKALEWLAKQQKQVVWKKKEENLNDYLKEIKRVLKPNGRLYLTVELRFIPSLRQALAEEGFKVTGAEEVSIPFGKKQIISPTIWDLLESSRRGQGSQVSPIRLVAVKKGMK